MKLVSGSSLTFSLCYSNWQSILQMHNSIHEKVTIFLSVIEEHARSGKTFNFYKSVDHRFVQNVQHFSLVKYRLSPWM
jgi:hypothetical protein